MNKKGFTLVELLAVIAILAILVIIALPNVMGMFNSAKLSSFETEVKNIIKYSGDEWINDNLHGVASSDRKYCNHKTTMANNGLCGSANDSTTKEIKVDTRAGLFYYIEFDSTGKITKAYVYDKNNQFNYVREAADIKAADVTVPNETATVPEGSTSTLVGSGTGASVASTIFSPGE